MCTLAHLPSLPPIPFIFSKYCARLFHCENEGCYMHSKNSVKNKVNIQWNHRNIQDLLNDLGNQSVLKNHHNNISEGELGQLNKETYIDMFLISKLKEGVT